MGRWNSPRRPPRIATRLLALGLVVATLGLLQTRTAVAVNAFTFAPHADTYVSSYKPNTNFGSSTRLRADASPTLRSYLRFVVQGLSGSLSLATLRVFSSSSSSTGYQVHAVSDSSWGERTATFNNAPAISSSSLGSSGPFSSGVWTSVDLTSLVAGNGTYSIALTTTSSSALSMRSKEASSNRPQLVIQSSSQDTTAPSIPTNVVATGVSFNRVDVAWNPSTDNVGVAGYDIYRNGVLEASVGSTTSLYADTTVAPSTAYSYSVDAFDQAGNHSLGSAAASGTSAGPSTDPVVAAAGDIACDPSDPSFNSGNGTGTACRQRYTSDILASAGLTAVLALGDEQYICGASQAFQQSYDPSWGRSRTITRPVPGNHEYVSSAQYPNSNCSSAADASGYFSYFGSGAGPSTGYYSYDVGAWHLIALNSNCTQVGGCAAGSPQELWLQADLAAHPSSCTLAYWHHPRFSSGAEHGNDSRTGAFWQDLYAARADLILVGHEHIYERFAPQDPSQNADPNGIREFIAGTGGQVHHTLAATAQPNSQVRNATTFGVIELTLHPQGYDWAFVPEAGGFTDAGSTSCH